MSDFNDKATVSGSVVSIENGADEVGAKSCVVTVLPTLSGVSSVTEKQTGRNLFDKDNANVVNGYIDVSAFNTGNANAKTIYIPIKGGMTYTVSKTVGARFSIATSDVIPTSGATYTSRQAGNTSASLTITAGANDTYLWAWVFLDGTDTGTLADMLASVMVEYGSTPHAYEPYQTPTQYTASLGRTIYGGEVDIVNGEGESSYKIITVGNSGWNYYSAGSYIYRNFDDKVIPEIGDSDHVLVTDNPDMPYGGVNYASQFQDLHIYQAHNPAIYIKDTSCTSLNEFYTKYSNMKIGYELATPTDFTFTGQEVPTRLGYNAFWSDSGDTELTYYKSGYGYTSVTVHKETPGGEPVSQTAKLHKVIYAGEVDVIKGTAKPKNLLKLTDGTYSLGNTGATATILSGSLSVTGTTTNSGGRTMRLSDYFLLKKGTYFLSPVISTSPYVRSYLNKKSDNTVVGYSSGSSFTVAEDIEVYFGVNVESGYTYNTTITPQLEKGSSPSDYVPHFDPFTFPPISMETDEGENTLFANEGDSAIIYRKQAE